MVTFRDAAGSLLLTTSSAFAQVATYDAVEMLVTIPSVSAFGQTYTNVTLRNRGDFVFDLTAAGGPVSPAYPGVASYDGATNVLSLPAVKVGSATYIGVELRNNGNFVFTLQSATALPQSIADQVDAYARSLEALTATALPAGGAAHLALTDSCWANDGRTRANWIANYDANRAEFEKRDAYLIGRRVQNIQILAVRNLVNADSSPRREIDVQWDVSYLDGTTARGEKSTLTSGSSAGTPGCTSPTTGDNLRALGNQQKVQTAVRPINHRHERYSILFGAARSPLALYMREIDFLVIDPMGKARYVIVTGPGPTNTVGGATYPFSLKLLSPRLLIAAPELQGKIGNFLNWREDHTFRRCLRAGPELPVAPVADCAGQGASGSGWGSGLTDVANASNDRAFADQGWIAGGVYRFDVHDDDGWKAVNGHSGRTPIATYFAKLDRLPYTFVEMTGRYPLLTVGGGMTMAQVAANAASATPSPLTLSWTRPGVLPDGRALHLFQAWEYHHGPKIGNPGASLYPGYRNFNQFYPGTTATSTANFIVTPKLPDQAGKTYTEYLIYYSEPGTANQIRSLISIE